MGTTQPIRDKRELKRFMEYYKDEKPNPRNFAMISFGLHTALRISDILQLAWGDVYDFENSRFRDHVCVREKKTGKQNTVPLNAHVRSALTVYKDTARPSAADYVFSKLTDHSAPLSRSQAYRVVTQAAKHTLQEPGISCHSLRKTFGYHAWKQGASPVLLMDIYNHSSYQVTKRYLGISQDERDAVYMEMDY